MHDATCPSVAHVLERKDGGLARVRTPGGRLSASCLSAVAEAARRFGNATIEITNRANLQLRGVQPGAEQALAAALMAAGASTGGLGDLRRNVLAGPMSGLDPSAAAGVDALVGAIVARLDAEPALDDLSPKAGVTVDAGGRWHLGGRRDDVVVTATPTGTWQVTGVTMAAADVPEAVCASLVATLAAGARRQVEVPVPAGASAVAAGPLGAGAGWVGAMAPLGRLPADAAAAVAEVAATSGDGAVRLTPWRGVVLAGVAHGPQALVALAGAGLLTSPGDPLTAVVACAGSGGCTSAWTDAPGDAAALADLRRTAGKAPLLTHVSGCSKRCAHPRDAAVTLIGVAPGTYDVMIGDTVEASGLDAPDAIALAGVAGRARMQAGTLR